MVKEITKTPNFLRQLRKLDRSLYDKVEKIIIKIMQNPKIGKPIMYSRKGTRELYIKPFRLSYYYEENKDSLILLDIYHKDRQ